MGKVRVTVGALKEIFDWDEHQSFEERLKGHYPHPQMIAHVEAGGEPDHFYTSGLDTSPSITFQADFVQTEHELAQFDEEGDLSNPDEVERHIIESGRMNGLNISINKNGYMGWWEVVVTGPENSVRHWVATYYAYPQMGWDFDPGGDFEAHVVNREH